MSVIGKVLQTSVEADKMKDGKVDIDALKAIAFDPYTHGYYIVFQRVGEAFKDGMKLKKTIRIMRIFTDSTMVQRHIFYST